MAKKKTTRKKKSASWEKIGEMIGKKIESEFKGKKCGPFYHMNLNKTDDGGFFGRALFIVGVLLLLNHVGLMQGVSIWIQILIGVGFAFMRF